MKKLTFFITFLLMNSSFAAITKQEFDSTIKKIQNEFSPDAKAFGAKLEILGKWNENNPNAHTRRTPDNKTWQVLANGGFARLKHLNQDGFTILLCHEVGHHLGGYPKVNRAGMEWASNEGQSDYFATLKCSKRIFNNHKENSKVVAQLKIPKIVAEKCNEAYEHTEDFNICLRSAMASKNLIEATNLEVNKAYSEPPAPLSFEKAARSYAKGYIYQHHSDLQCRLNTLFNGSLCNKDLKNPLSDKEESSGNCSLSQGDILGVRPNCWYYPNE